jgi:hypothetical protein
MLSKQNRNLSDRLIRIIEHRADELTQATIKELQSNSRTPSYHGLSYRDLYSRVYAVYHDLGVWLYEKSSDAVRGWYHGLGAKRYEEGIPLVEVLWALVLTKNRLVEHLSIYTLVDSAVELYQQQEFDRMISQFFDRALCYTAEGYAPHASTQGKGATTAAAVH